MHSPDLDDLSLTELCELLVTHTVELLDLMNTRGINGHLMRDKKREVEAIQAAIIKRRAENPGYFP